MESSIYSLIFIQVAYCVLLFERTTMGRVILTRKKVRELPDFREKDLWGRLRALPEVIS
jgi:hypothetical protein